MLQVLLFDKNLFLDNKYHIQIMQFPSLSNYLTKNNQQPKSIIKRNCAIVRIQKENKAFYAHFEECILISLFFESQNKDILASIRNGIIAKFTELQPSAGVAPEQFINAPEATEAMVTKP